jgi:hypothetical protein
MLLAAAREFGATPDDCVFVGDDLGHSIDSSPDRLAADAVGIEFWFERDFFGRGVTLAYRLGVLLEWMEPHERIGLDIEATAARFEDLMRENMMAWHHVVDVRLNRHDGDIVGGGDLVFDEYADAVLVEKSVTRHAAESVARGEHIVYETAEDHAEAMATHTAVYPGLRLQLQNVYGISQDEADALIALARGERR